MGDDDFDRRNTLLLIELLSSRVGEPNRGTQLVLVAADHSRAGDLGSAMRVLKKVSDTYLADFLPGLQADRQEVAEAVAELVDQFGPDLALARRTKGEA